jgi:hypothetical protein
MQSEDKQQETVEEKTLSTEDIQKYATAFAEKLDENDGKPISQIGELIEKCGLDFVQKLV